MKNKELELAKQFVSQTNRNIYVTGKAGTGKTTFLRNLQKEVKKRMIIVAPTGVAAINARGVTIHSFFQLPFGPIIPNTNNSVQRKFNRQKINIIKTLDLIIIDEISMVRADVLDGIDQVLRRYKDRNKPFGGTQMLFIGDLQQLSPVIKPNEWDLLRKYYNNIYFFNSLAYQKENAISIELKHIYRQQNNDFIKILNEIRNNSLSTASSEILNKQYKPNFKQETAEGYITLTTHNHRANSINIDALKLLTTKQKTYSASITGNFKENNYPAQEHITLKVGAQVMFIKNDPSPEKQYYNGKIGTVIALDSTKVTVQCDHEIIETGVLNWENINYTVDDQTQKISEKIEGTFTQIPLRLAWAITIHKSQGLTFEKAIIDAESSFAHGQTYVALSRCKTLEGIVLKSKIHSNSIVNDTTVSLFNKEIAINQPTDAVLKASKKQYELDILEEIFNFNALLYPINRLIDIYYKHQSVIEGNLIEPLLKIKDLGIVKLMKISNNFKIQLKNLAEGIDSIEKNKPIQNRFKKGIIYFREATDKDITKIVETISFDTDNKTVKNDIKKQIDNFEELLQLKTIFFSELNKEFNIEEFLKIKTKALLNKKKTKRKSYKLIINQSHEELFESLQNYRLSVANSKNVGAYAIFTQKTLLELCNLLPEDKEQLKNIHGMGKIRIQKYGDQILEIINQYKKDKNIKAQNNLINDKQESKKNTKEITLELFNEGLSVSEIAKKRNLVNATIEGHLIPFVKEGIIEVNQLINPIKIKEGEQIIKDNSFDNLTELKQIAGDKFSYFELRLLLIDKK